MLRGPPIPKHCRRSFTVYVDGSPKDVNKASKTPLFLPPFLHWTENPALGLYANSISHWRFQPEVELHSKTEPDQPWRHDLACRVAPFDPIYGVASLMISTFRQVAENAHLSKTE
jgi:hypothetical protein